MCFKYRKNSAPATLFSGLPSSLSCILSLSLILELFLAWHASPAFALEADKVSPGIWNFAPMAIFIAILAAFFWIFAHRIKNKAQASLGIEKAHKERLMGALALIEREKIAMRNIQAALGSGPWSMEFDAHDNIIACVWTDTFRKMLGYNDENDFPNVLSSWSDLLHEDDKAYVMREYWDTVKDYTGQKTYDVEYRLLTKNAGWRWFHAAGRLSRREDGSPISFVGFFVDIDDNKKLQASLEARTEDLRKALDAAQYANQAKTMFLNNMSHDIRTPMNAIIGFTALAAAHIENREQTLGYLKKISTSSKHLLSLINDVLDMSRIESGKVKIEENASSLPDIIHDIKTIVQADIHAKQLDFRISTVDIVNEHILCDRLRLNQVLLNLLSNAIKFTPHGGLICFSISEGKNAPDGFADYEFQLKDTGIGMSQEFLKSVFSPFERERTSTVSGIQGTGLGMAITKNIVEMMGGDISVESEKGVGTTFTVHLRFKTSSCPMRNKTIPALEGLRALVVDDDFNTCSSVTSMLADIGMRPDWTTSGKEAVLRVKLAKEQNFGYVAYIIDLLMPDMNGVEVVRRIRGLVEENTPIIILTAYDWADIEDEAREAGVTAFCSKPIFQSELRDILEAPYISVQECADAESLSFHGKKVLLVEDNDLNQEIALEMLQNAGFEVDMAENGARAVEIMKKVPHGTYDLILMDIQMPVMNGYEATKQIRALPDDGIASIPIIAMTADAFEEDKKAAADAGMNGHIAKPIDFTALLRLLAQMLESRNDGR